MGDRVVALPEFKAWAELVAVSEKFVYKIPENMSFSDAAAITLSYLVAHVLVYDLASIKPGSSVLLHSAGGGVVSTFTASFLYIAKFIVIRTSSLKFFGLCENLMLEFFLG